MIRAYNQVLKDKDNGKLEDKIAQLETFINKLFLEKQKIIEELNTKNQELEERMNITNKKSLEVLKENEQIRTKK